MRRILAAATLTAALLVPVSGRAAGRERLVLAKIYDRAGDSTFEILTPEEYGKLQSEIRGEQMLFGRALLAAQKAWKEREESGMFPRGAVSPRRVLSQGTFFDREKAEERLARSQETKAKADERRADREQGIHRNPRTGEVTSRSRSGETVERRRQKQEEKDAVYARARELFEEKLRELLTPAPAGDKQADAAADAE